MQMDLDLFNAAATGNISYLTTHAEQLPIQTTPQGNSILHVYIIASTKKISNSSTQTQTQTQTQIQTQESTLEKILEQCPALLTKPNIKGETPLQLAARHGNHEIVKSLIRINKEADLESGREGLKQMLRTINADKDTALHEAARGNYPEIVRILSEEDPDGTSYLANDAGETPLYIATERGHDAVVQQILDLCQSPGVKGPLGRTVLHAAVIHNHKAITKRIVQEIKREKIGATLAKQVDNQGWTALHYAAHFGRVKMVRLLLKFDRSMTYESNNSDKLTALHIAAPRGKKQVIEELLKRCPDCSEQVDCKGWNALHFAAEKGDEVILNLILNTSPLCSNLINERDQEGNTILHHLATTSLTRSVQMPSLHSIIDKMTYNKLNQTALDVILVHAKLMQSTSIDDQTIISQRANAGFLSRYGVPCGKRILHEEKVWKEEWKGEESNFKRASAGQLVVAALIATVTFAAGFTLPGGYKGGDGPAAGEAVLTRKPAFKVFVMTNTLALVLSISAVFHHLFLLLQRKHHAMLCLFMFAFFLTIAATGLMGVAFVTGMYAVLEQSSGLAIAICVLGFLFFILYSCYALNFALIVLSRRWRAYAIQGNPWYKIPYKVCSSFRCIQCKKK